MAINITGKFKPQGNFALMDAEDIEMPDGTRLSDYKFEADDTVETELLPLQEYDGFAYNDEFGCYTAMVAEAPFSFTVGETYTVAWDGGRYDCVAQDLNAITPGAVGIGDLTEFGGTGNEEPFIIVTVGGSVLLAAFNEQDSHYIRIYQTVSAQKLPAVTEEDNGKFLRVVDGAWAAVAMLDVSEVGL